MNNNKYSQTKTISFAKENLDVYDILQQQSNASRYICDAIRFYEQHKNKPTPTSTLSENEIEKLVYVKLLQLIQNNSSLATTLDLDISSDNLNEPQKTPENDENLTPNIYDLMSKNSSFISDFHRKIQSIN